ncbi:hypothetical protein [Demequina aurantiaca]|uniref:hypothetical protein n=1 Tax=Demequina aurantiaca TaxID=676200 RepID=UPI000785E910|nr:hypothetical protein [Demequina aurantiaca]
MAKKRTRRALWALTIVPGLVLIAACAGQSSGSDDIRSQQPADAVGVVTSVSKDATTVAVGFSADKGYEYFDGATFDLPTAGGLEDPDGLAADPNNLAVGDHIEVWVNECAESQPVQCADPVARIATDANSS